MRRLLGQWSEWRRRRAVQRWLAESPNVHIEENYLLSALNGTSPQAVTLLWQQMINTSLLPDHIEPRPDLGTLDHMLLELSKEPGHSSRHGSLLSLVAEVAYLAKTIQQTPGAGLPTRERLDQYLHDNPNTITT